ncbi:hypothetical protein D7X87_00970 [bacterium D16-54]|nr:hypothetical protein D7X87_00970 [bacterium D16-54]RKJ16882.1 hypothetical protein D7X65_00970 [bacterium D16-56]
MAENKEGFCCGIDRFCSRSLLRLFCADKIFVQIKYQKACSCLAPLQCWYNPFCILKKRKKGMMN